MKKIAFLFSFLLFCIFVGYFLSFLALYFLNDRFLYSHVIGMPFEKCHLLPLSQKELKKVSAILKQPFFYLTKGSQCYVFKSEDEQYILKLFKNQRLRYFNLSKLAPLPSFLLAIEKEMIQNKEVKKKQLLDSCLIAHEELKEESGLIYLHFDPQDPLPLSTLIFDKLGRCYPLRLNETCFILQKKAELIQPTLEALLNGEKREEIGERIRQLIDLLTLRCQKGIYDEDACLSKNIGFLADRAIFLDIGNFSEYKPLRQPDIYIPEIKKISEQFMSWLKNQNPELISYFNQEMQHLEIRSPFL
jgi:hypothetical protein